MKFHEGARRVLDDGESLPVRGAWVEIIRRGTRLPPMKSLPVRGAWVEMSSPHASSSIKPSLPVRGAWVEIWDERNWQSLCERRSPCGERGLKFSVPFPDRAPLWSLPVRGAWVEM